MKALDIDSSFAARKELAKELGYTGDSNDSASMNIWLHKQVMAKLAANGGKLPADVKLLTRLAGSVDMVHLFASQAAGLAGKLRGYREAIAPDGMIWVSWPKKASDVATDLTDVVVRDIALPLGLVDIKVCAIDDSWSGLKFVIPKDQRGKRAK